MNAKLAHPPPPHALLRDAADAAKSMRRVRLYSRFMFQDFKDKIYRRKTRPHDLNDKAESLYDENLLIKSKLHNLEQHIIQQKTQNKMLNNELEKQHDIVKRLFLSQKMTCDKCAGTTGGAGGSNETVTLILNLKRELDLALKKIVIKD